MASIYQHYLNKYSNGKLPCTTLDDLIDELEKINQEKKYKIVMSKNYTSKNQSEILIKLGIPIDTADMWYGVTYKKIGREDDNFGESIEYIELSKYPDIKENAYTKKGIPAWSLDALLDVLPSSTLDSSDDHHYRLHCMERFTEWYDNPIDACYEMILKLHEQKLL